MSKSDERDLERCEGEHTHGRAVEPVRRSMPGDEAIYSLAELFKVFGDETRIRILYALSEAEMCVCDIASVLGMSQSAISHQLRVLKQNRLVRFRRDGKTIFYSLNDSHIHSILGAGLEHVLE